MKHLIAHSVAPRLHGTITRRLWLCPHRGYICKYTYRTRNGTTSSPVVKTTKLISEVLKFFGDGPGTLELYFMAGFNQQSNEEKSNA